MDLFPAIDLLDGQLVRLLQGNYEAKTVYATDPVEQAKVFAALGFEWLHVVDLNAARSGGEENLAVIARICRESGLRVQVGGGIRNREALEKRLHAGAKRLVIGTAAVRDPAFLREAIGLYGSAIAVGADCHDDRVAVSGWEETTQVLLDDFCAELASIGLSTLIYTDISRDGALRGPNLSVATRLIRQHALAVVVSGGVAADSDIVAAEHIGAAGVITGKAIYEGKVDLGKCLRYLKNLQK